MIPPGSRNAARFDFVIDPIGRQTVSDHVQMLQVKRRAELPSVEYRDHTHPHKTRIAGVGKLLPTFTLLVIRFLLLYHIHNKKGITFLFFAISVKAKAQTASLQPVLSFCS